MKNLKMLYIALIALVAGAFVACTSEFEPGPQVSGPQVAFIDTNATSVDITGDPTEGTQKLVLSRVETKGELTVFVNAEASEGAHLFNIPEEVTFADGEATAELVYTIDCDNFANDKTYTVNFLILDELGTLTTPYGYKEWTVRYAVNPWVLLKDDKGNNAKGKLRGVGAFEGFWSGVDGVWDEIDVNVYKHKNAEQYKVEDPWVTLYVLAFGATSEDDLKSQFSWTNADLIIDCTDPNNVVIPQQSIGITENYNGYGEGYVYAEGGTFEDGIISFPAEMMAYIHSNLVESYGWFATNPSGAWRLVLPGVKVADYSLSVTYSGMDVASDNKTCTAKLDFTYGADVTGIKYLIVNGHHENNPAEPLAKLLAGEDENITAVENFKEGAGVMNLKLGLEQGLYTIVAAALDKEGAMNAKTAVAKSFFFPGLGAPEEHPVEVGIMTEKFSVVYPNYAAYYPDYSALAYCIYGTNLTKVVYLAQKTSTIDYYLNQGVSLEDLVLANGKSDTDLTLVNGDNGWVSNLINLEANTSYTIAVYAENEYGESKTVYATHTTDPMPYSGELVIGDYRMYNKVVSGEDEFEFENIFTIEPQVVNGTISETDFFVKNLGLEMDAKWYAAYDATAGTFSISGVEYGYENYGNQFGALYAYANQEKTAAMGFFSYATAESEKGNDPLVFTVDATTKQLCALQNDLFIVPVLDMNTGEQIDTWGYYLGATTTVAPYVPTAGGSDNGGAQTASVLKAKEISVPFSSVQIRKSVVESKSMLQNIESTNSVSSTSFGRVLKSVKPSLVENYQPEKKAFTAVKANLNR